MGNETIIEKDLNLVLKLIQKYLIPFVIGAFVLLLWLIMLPLPMLLVYLVLFVGEPITRWQIFMVFCLIWFLIWMGIFSESEAKFGIKKSVGKKPSSQKSTTKN